MAKRKKKRRKKFKRKKNKKKNRKKSQKVRKTKKTESNELIFKVPKDGLVLPTSINLNMKKNISFPLKIMKVFGKKKVNELIGLNLIQK